MIKILRNCVLVAVVAMLLGANIYWQLLNPYAACAGALIAAYLAGLAVEWALVKRGYAEMWRQYGDDWAK